MSIGRGAIAAEILPLSPTLPTHRPSFPPPILSKEEKQLPGFGPRGGKGGGGDTGGGDSLLGDGPGDGDLDGGDGLEGGGLSDRDLGGGDGLRGDGLGLGGGDGVG